VFQRQQLVLLLKFGHKVVVEQAVAVAELVVTAAKAEHTGGWPVQPVQQTTFCVLACVCAVAAIADVQFVQFAPAILVK
jgi:hypothetical protein